MGRGPKTDEIDYHAETRGERKDRAKAGDAGQTLAERLLEQAAEEKARKQCRQSCCFFTLIIMGFIMYAVAIVTPAWYVYAGEVKLSAVDGNPVLRKQEWGFSLTGIHALVQYCDFFDTSNCMTDIDVFRYFDNAKNTDTTQWKAEYVPACGKADTAASNLKAVIVVALILYFFCFVVIILAAKGKSQKICSYVSLGMALTGAFASFMMIGLFMKDTEPLRSQLREKSFVPAVAGPEYTMGWSSYVCMCGGVITTIAMIPMYLVLRAAHQGDGTDSQLLRERDKRVQAYLSDITATSYIYESKPQDSIGYKETGGASVRYPGWTTEVESEAVNQFSVDPSHDIGGHRVRWIEVDVPRRCCCFTCGMKKEKVQQSADTIKPPIEQVGRQMNRQPPKPKPKPKQDAPEVKVELNPAVEMKIRPMSPKGPMGGTFSLKMESSPEKMDAQPLERPGTSFRPATGNTGIMSGFRPGTAQLLTGVKSEIPPGAPGSPLSFSPAGQPLAERSRAVSRAPPPERRKKGFI